MDKKLQPRLRFRGFTDPWQQRKLGEVVTKYLGGGTPRTSNAEYWSGSIPWIQSSDIKEDVIIGVKAKKFISEEAINGSAAKLVPANSIAVATRVGVGKLALIPFSYSSSQDFISLVSFNANHLYLIYSLQKTLKAKIIKAQGTSIKGITRDDLLVEPISLPNPDEQSRIGEFFKTLDDLIAAEERKKDLLEQKKKAYLQKIFSQELRFKGFNEPWQRRRLGSFFEVNNERNGNLFSYNKIISVSSMTYRPPERGSAANSLQSYKVIRIGDLAFDGHKHKNRPFGHLNINNLGEGLMTPRFTAFRPKGRIEISYWKQYVENDYLMRKILSTSTQKGTLMNEIVVSDFLKKVILIPTVEEQALIGNLFKLLDDQISSQQKKVDLLKRKKKAYLQQMFV